MFAVVAAVVAAISAFEPSVEDVRLLPLAVMFLALHHAVGEWSPWRR